MACHLNLIIQIKIEDIKHIPSIIQVTEYNEVLVMQGNKNPTYISHTYICLLFNECNRALEFNYTTLELGF